MELGNLVMGNSRGPIEVDRELVNSKEWEYLVHILLQVEDYHCSIDKKYFQDYKNDLEFKERTNNLLPNKYGGYVCEYNGEIIFEIFPYWWGDCTCGAEEENYKLEKKWKNELFTPYQWKTYMTFEDWCDDACPACSWKKENQDKTKDELLKICNCGIVKKNIRLINRKEKLKDKIKEYERREIEESIPHKEECLLLKHNFVYHPGQEDEFWIDWYKYPFRDSYMNKQLTNDEIKNIWNECSEKLKLVIKENNGTWIE